MGVGIMALIAVLMVNNSYGIDSGYMGFDCYHISTTELSFLQKVSPNLHQVDMTEVEKDFMNRIYSAQYQKCMGNK